MDQLGITVFDVAVIAVAVFGAMIGMSAGFAHAILFIASWIGAGWAAWRFSKVVQPEVEQVVGSTELAYFISMLAVFVAALIMLIMLTNMLSRSVRASPLGKPDRILGAGFGVLCAWVALGTAFLFYGYLGPRQLPPAVEGGRHLPDDPGDGNLRRTPSSAGIPDAPAAPGHGYGRYSRACAPGGACVSAGRGSCASRAGETKAPQ